MPVAANALRRQPGSPGSAPRVFGLAVLALAMGAASWQPIGDLVRPPTVIVAAPDTVVGGYLDAEAQQGGGASLASPMLSRVPVLWCGFAELSTGYSIRNAAPAVAPSAGSWSSETASTAMTSLGMLPDSPSTAPATSSLLPASRRGCAGVDQVDGLANGTRAPPSR
jgi:hypothetical protein